MATVGNSLTRVTGTTLSSGSGLLGVYIPSFPEDGDVTAVRFNLEDTGGTGDTYQAAIYGPDAGAETPTPNARIGLSNSRTDIGTEGTYEFTFSPPVSLTGGQGYRFVIGTDSTAGSTIGIGTGTYVLGYSNGSTGVPPPSTNSGGWGASANIACVEVVYTAAGGVTITSVSSGSTFDNGESITIGVTGAGATQGGGSVIIVTEDDVQGVTFATQAVTDWADDEIVITAVRGSLPTATNLYLFVINDDAESNAAGSVVQFNSIMRLKLRVNAAAVGATVDGVVFAEPAGGAITGAEIGEFTGATLAAGTGDDTGYAILDILCSSFGGGSLTDTDEPVVYLKSTTHFTPIWPATVYEA